MSYMITFPKHYWLILILFSAVALLSCGKKDPDAAVWEAIENGNLTELKELLSKSCNLNAKNANGFTPLRLAVESESPIEIFQLLVQNGADPDKSLRDSENDNLHLIHMACFEGDSETVKYLVKGGVDVNLIWSEEFGGAPITFSSSSDIETIRFLLENGANPKADHGGALCSASSDAEEKTVELLLQYGADPNIPSVEGDGRNNGFTPLGIAVNNGNMGTIKILIKNGADINASCGYGKTPFSVAKDKNYAEALQLFEKANKNLNRQTTKTTNKHE